MATRYHFGNERRLGDRRVWLDPNYAGPERRDADRRAKREPRSLKPWIAVAALALVVTDWTVWNGYYRHALFVSLDRDAAKTREWGGNVWQLG